MGTDAEGPLRGIRVLDLSRVLAGPFATMGLGELGARVIKIEHVRGGDETRAWGPPFAGGESAYYLAINRNKESVALDLRTPVAQRVVHRLAVSWADVVVENFRPGALAAFGLSLEGLRAAQPRLITASLRGYPAGDDRPGYDFIIQGAGGLMSITGPVDGEPHKVGVAVTDLFAGQFLQSGILAALFQRERSGRGQHLDVSLWDTQLALLANVGSACLLSGKSPRRYGNAHPQLAPYEVFACQDGRITIGVGNDGQFLALAGVLGSPEWAEDERFRHNPDRVVHRRALRELMEAVLRTRPGERWLEALTAAGVPCGPIRAVDEALKGPETMLSGAVVQMAHPSIPALPQIRLPWRFSRGSAAPRRPPPLLGEHTRSVLRETGLEDAEIDAALASGAAGQHAGAVPEVGAAPRWSPAHPQTEGRS